MGKEREPKRAAAERFLSAYIQELDSNEEIDVDAVCKSHPEHESEIREIVGEWQDLLGMLDQTQTIVRSESHDSVASNDLLARLKDRAFSETRYEMQEEIGRGGMGIVLSVWDRDLRRQDAMKVMRKGRDRGQKSDHSIALDRFLEEAQITGQLDHPGIVPVYELGMKESGQVYFTMPHVKGQTLETILDLTKREEDGWTQARTLGVLLKACEAMAYAHAKNVIHRDLKPANIMVGHFGEVYVMDWGLARILGVETKGVDRQVSPKFEVRTDRRDFRDSDRHSPLLTADGDVVGTPAYMSPEQASGDLENIGQPSDVYALGAILYHLLAGRMPFGDEHDVSPRATWARVKKGPPKSIAELAPKASPELIAICEKAMAREPTHRYGSTVELEEDLRAYLEDRVVRAHRTGAVVELRKWMRRNRLLAAACMIAVVFLIAGLGVASFLIAQLNEEKEKLSATKDDLAESLKDYQHIADPEVFDGLVEVAENDLWPRRPEQVSRMQSWLKRVRELVVRFPQHVEALGDLQEKGEQLDGSTWKFQEPEDELQFAVLSKFVAELNKAKEPDGLIKQVEARITVAEEVVQRTIEDHMDDWEVAIEEIKETPQYNNLDLPSQVGLIPLEADPDSELWEFFLWESGDRPARDPETQRWRIKRETGIVMVLVPGGTFSMGATRASQGPNFDPHAKPDEGPVHPVTLEPFFISKFEITQGQWTRIMNKNESVFAAEPNALSRPVEEVTWHQCQIAMNRLGLRLPTEAQWEYACRAGTTTAWSSGNDKQDLIDFCNLADQSLDAFLDTPIKNEDWDDGFDKPAVVGSLAPNAFGLHDMHGNVFEWCRDSFARFDVDAQPLDGLRSIDPKGLKIMKGGGFHSPAREVRSAARLRNSPTFRNWDLGCRPILQISSD